MTYASPWKRVVALFADLLILAAAVVVSQFFIERLTGIFPFKGDRSGWLLEGYTLLTVSLPTWLYFIYFERSRHQATPGKLLMRLIVADDDGHPLRPSRIFLRTAVKMFPFEMAYMAFFIPTPMFSEAGRGEFRATAVMVVAMGFVYLLMMTWNDAKQSMHDLIAESVVLDRGRRLRLFRKRRA